MHVASIGKSEDIGVGAYCIIRQSMEPYLKLFTANSYEL